MNTLSDAHAAEGPNDAANIIGRFGVGFYSVFMVADSVKVSSRRAFVKEGEENPVYDWVSDGLGTYSITKSDDAKPVRGTSIEIHLKDDAKDFLEEYRLKSVIRTHSGFVPFPVFVNNEQVNTQPALWREPKSNVTHEQYVEFYKSFSYDSKEPIEILHIAVDVPVQFQALLFIPDHKMDIHNLEADLYGLDLYSKRVLIKHHSKGLLPSYLSFVQGVVDVEDLPLNISRETLQENLLIGKIKQVLVKQILNALEKMAKDNPEKYESFWNTHQTIFKANLEDFANRERLCALLRFNSSSLADGKDGKIELTSLEDYMSRAIPEQKTFWYLSAPNRESAKLNPHLRRFIKKGIEVLYFFEPFDEFMIERIGKYKDWDFKSVEVAEENALDAFPDKEDSEEKEAAPLTQEETDLFEQLRKHVKDTLGEKVKEVRFSDKDITAPAVLVSKGVSSSMEKLMRIISKDESVPVKDLELNRDHPLLRSMLKIFKANPIDPILNEMIGDLFDSAMMFDGYVREPQIFATRLQSILEKSASWYTATRGL